MSTQIGTCKFFNELKGFGFLTSNEGDVFVHISDLNGLRLNKGDRVEFEIVPAPKGKKAVNVEKLDANQI